MKITKGILQQAENLKNQGLSWYRVSKILIVSVDGIRRRLDKEYDKRRAIEAKKSYRKHLKTRRETMRKYIKRTYVPK